MPQKMSTTAKSLVENFGEEGLPTGKVAMIFRSEEHTSELQSPC